MTTNDWHTHAVQAAAAPAVRAAVEDQESRTHGRGFTAEPDPDALTGDLAALTRVLLGVADVVDKEDDGPAADVIDVAGLVATDEIVEAPAPARVAPSRVIHDLAFLDG